MDVILVEPHEVGGRSGIHDYVAFEQEHAERNLHEGCDWNSSKHRLEQYFMGVGCVFFYFFACNALFAWTM